MNTRLILSSLSLVCSLLGCASPGVAPATEPPAATADLSALANSAPQLKPDAKNVGILIFDGLFITELVAPFDIYKHTGDKMNVFTVAQSTKPIRTYEGLGLVSDYAFDKCPKIDVLVVPSGIHSIDTDLDNAKLIGFIKERAAKAEWVTSHCWGAYKLAKAGLLEGKSCMTFPSYIDPLQEKFPGIKTQKGKRFVVDGNIVTSGGGLAAFEAAVWVVEKYFGAETAQKVAEGLVFAEQNREYSKDPAIGGGN